MTVCLFSIFDPVDIVADMTRQYKAMQDDLISRINILETHVQELTDSLGMFF